MDCVLTIALPVRFNNKKLYKNVYRPMFTPTVYKNKILQANNNFAASCKKKF